MNKASNLANENKIISPTLDIEILISH